MRTKRILALALALVLVLSTGVFAAIPNNTLLVGNKAYDIPGYVATGEHNAEIQAAVDNADAGQIFYQLDGVQDQWAGVFGGTPSTAELDALGQITYKGADGKEVVYDKFSGNPVTEPTELKVESVRAINATTVQITFSKAINKATVIESDDTLIAGVITFTPQNGGNTITDDNAAAELSADGKTLTITTDYLVGGEFFDGEYLIQVDVSVEDEDGNFIEPYAKIVDLSDSNRPTISGPTYPQDNLVKFTLSEAVNQADVAALDFESLLTVTDKNGQAVTLADGDVVLAADKKSFTIDLDSGAFAAYAAGDTFTVKVVGLKDFAGNLITPNPTTFTIQKKDSDDQVAPTVASVEAVGNTELVVIFSEEIAYDSTNSRYFTLDINDTVAFDIDNAQVDTPDNETFTIDLTNGALVTALDAADGSTDAALNLSGVNKVTIDNVADAAGNAMAATYNKLLEFNADTDAPALSSVSVKEIAGEEYIVAEFNEDLADNGAGALNPAPVAIPQANVEYVADGVVKQLTGGIDAAAVTGYDKDGDGDFEGLKIEIGNYDGANAVMPAGDYTITLPVGYIQDKLGNATTATIDLNVTVGDVTKPVVNSHLQDVAGDLDEVVVTFSKEVTNATALNVNNYTVEGQKVFASAIFEGDKKTVRLTLKDDVIDLTGDYTIQINNIADASGNVIDPYTGTINLTENVSPELVSAEMVDADTVKLTFSENLEVVSVAATDFVVKVDGVEDTVALGPVTANTVELNLSAPIDTLNDVVTVTVEAGAVNDSVATAAKNSNDEEKTVTASIN